MKFIDLFAGIGGFRIALENNNSKCVYSSEWDKYAIKTYEYNFNDIPFGDITKINENEIPEHDILCGGFPCQAFSVSGKQGGFKDTRGTLFFDIARIVKKKKPSVLFLENVKNLYKHDNGNTFSLISKVLDEIGYNIFSDIIDSSNYGLPQHRERVYIVCFKKELNVNKFEFPKPTYKRISLGDIVEKNLDFEKYRVFRNDISFKKNNFLKTKDLFETKFLKPIRIGTINKGGQGERIYSDKGHAITLSAYGGGVAGKTGAYLINGIIRQLTPRECLRVQGFPENFDFPNDISIPQIYKMCGNSVSVPVIEMIYQKVLSYL